MVSGLGIALYCASANDQAGLYRASSPRLSLHALDDAVWTSDGGSHLPPLVRVVFALVQRF